MLSLCSRRVADRAAVFAPGSGFGVPGLVDYGYRFPHPAGDRILQSTTVQVSKEHPENVRWELMQKDAELGGPIRGVFGARKSSTSNLGRQEQQDGKKGPHGVYPLDWDWKWLETY